MAWYKIKVPDGLDGVPVVQEILQTFTVAYLNSVTQRKNKGVALFISDSANHLDPPDEHAYYFTPEASELCWPLLQKHNALPCVEPPPSSRGYIAGDEPFLDQASEQADKQSESD